MQLKVFLYLKTKRALFLLQGSFEEHLKVGSNISYSFTAEILTALCLCITTKIKDAENKYTLNYFSCYIYSLTWALLLHTLQSPENTASPDNKTNTSSSKLVLKNTILSNLNTARFELIFSTKTSKFEQLHCLVPSVLSFLWGIFLFGIADPSFLKATIQVQIPLADSPQLALRKSGK